MSTTLNSGLERAIARQFEDIADIGWFTDELPGESPQLKAVLDILQPRRGQKILDAGCGRGRFARHIAGTGAAVYGIDLTSTFIRAAKGNVPDGRFTGGSLSALPFADGSFDGIYCVEALEHVPDTALALSELTRILRPGGTLLIIDKSLQALDPGNGLPTFLVKPWAERKGKWMYPPDFPFRERWFWPGKLARELRVHCRSVEVRFIPEGRERLRGFIASRLSSLWMWPGPELNKGLKKA